MTLGWRIAAMRCMWLPQRTKTTKGPAHPAAATARQPGFAGPSAPQMGRHLFVPFVVHPWLFLPREAKDGEAVSPGPRG